MLGAEYHKSASHRAVNGEIGKGHYKLQKARSVTLSPSPPASQAEEEEAIPNDKQAVHTTAEQAVRSPLQQLTEIPCIARTPPSSEGLHNCLPSKMTTLVAFSTRIP